MNKKQLIVLLVGVLIIAVMALYPPWKYVCNKTNMEKVAPYGFIFSPPEIPGGLPEGTTGSSSEAARMQAAFEGKSLDDSFQGISRSFWAVQLDWYRLVLPVGTIGLLTFALILTFRVRGSAKE